MEDNPKTNSAKWLGMLCLVLLGALAFWKAWTLFKGSPIPSPAQEIPLAAKPAAAPALESRPAPPLKSAQKPLVPAPLVSKREIAVKKPAAIVVPVAPPPVVVVPVLPPPPPEPKQWSGNDTSVTHVGQVVIRNDRQWIHFWSEHHPHEAAPEIDFTKDMVLGVFAGPRPADPFSIRITDVRPDADKLMVYYREKLPPVGTFAVNVTVYPYYIKVYPRSNLTVKFVPQEPENVSR